MTRVYIWLPEKRRIGGETIMNIGHAALHLGNEYDMNKDEYYVSWWPEGAVDLRQPVTGSTPRCFRNDISAEGGLPHITYELESNSNSDINMNNAWKEIKYKKGAHYKLYDKNCSTVVARVLKAGDWQWPLGLIDQWTKTQNMVWTPGDIMDWCDKLCAIGRAKRQQNGRLPELFVKGPDDKVPNLQWSQLMFRALGVR